MCDNSNSPQPVFGWKKTLVYSLIPVALLLAFLEAAARVIEIWIPPRQVDLGQGFDPASRLFVPSPGDADTMTTNLAKETSFKKQAFARRKPERTLRAFALGGSSVNYLDWEFPQLAERLRKELADKFDCVEIVNCGGLSYGSHRLVPIAAEVVEYEPDLILIYSAHNEFEELEQLQLSDLKTLPLQRLLSKSALCRFPRDRIAAYRIGRLEKEHNKRILANAIPDAGRTWNHAFTDEEIARRMHTFRNNLAVIIQMCIDRGVAVVIGTVPSNLVKPNLPGKDGARYEEAAALFAKGDYARGLALGRRILNDATPRHQSSDNENDIIRSLARQYGVRLADVATAVAAAEPHQVPGETLFSDHCHLNPEGNKILAATYEAEIVRLFR